MSAWKPIETAPKDGTLVILIDIGDNTIWPVIARFSQYYDKWRDQCGYQAHNKTHWMPLPEPPQ